MLCPLCRAEWPDEIRYCGECGARMPDATVVNPRGVMQVEASTPRASVVVVEDSTATQAAANGVPSLLRGTQRVDLNVADIAAAADSTAPAAAAPSAASAASPASPASPASAEAAQPSALAAHPLPHPPPPPAHVEPSGPQVREVKRSFAPGAVVDERLPVPYVAPDTIPPPLAKRLDGALEDAWQLCDGRRRLLGGGTAILVCATVALCASVIGILALAPLWGGLVVVAARASAGRPIILDDFFAGVRCAVPLFLLGVMTFALVAVGTLALVLPGIYVAVCAMYAPFLVVDRELSPWHAIMASRTAVHESFVAHVGLAVVLVLVNLGGLACLGLGLLVTIPLTFVVLGVAYGRFLGYGTGVDRLTA